MIIDFQMTVFMNEKGEILSIRARGQENGEEATILCPDKGEDMKKWKCVSIPNPFLVKITAPDFLTALGWLVEKGCSF